jgi:hypothetical protein
MDGHSKATKPASAESYNMHVAYVNEGDWVKNSYSMNWHSIQCSTCPFWVGGFCFHFMVQRFFIVVSETTRWEILLKQYEWAKFTF